MDSKQIKDLMQAMGRYSIRRLSLKREGVELELESVNTEAEKIQAPVSEMVYEMSASEQHENPFSAHARQKLKNIPDVASEEENLLYITSPIVGTFYSQPAPNASPFIKAGDKVSSESIVCIIEAMKVMNEIKAGVSGEIVEILVSSGQAVEYGTKLFSVRKEN